MKLISVEVFCYYFVEDQKNQVLLFTFKVEVALCFVMRKDCIYLNQLSKNKFNVYVILNAMKYAFHYVVCDICVLHPANLIS